jgi:hypothetical protein
LWEWWNTEEFLVRTYARLQKEGKDLDRFFPTAEKKQQMLARIAAQRAATPNLVDQDRPARPGSTPVGQ